MSGDRNKATQRMPEDTVDRVERIMVNLREKHQKHHSVDDDFEIEADDPLTYHNFQCYEEDVEFEIVLQTSSSGDYVQVAIEAGDFMQTGPNGSGSEFDEYASGLWFLLGSLDGYGHVKKETVFEEVRTFKVPLQNG